MVDCTAGNGYDTLELAKIVALNDGQGKIYALDVQASARKRKAVQWRLFSCVYSCVFFFPCFVREGKRL